MASTIPDDMFASDVVHERTVELADGRRHKLYFKELPMVEYRLLTEAERSQDPSVRAKSAAGIIAASVVEPDGTPAMTVERAAALKPGAATAIFRAILELNGALTPVVAESEAEAEGN
ncbi:hypothetical protein [Bordetella sp. 15P40C-2]|uniref:hypothetical protein n=1 Tax=Bordetella sp. 15P40C-2 TaxID=2572246 RepID=UPI00132C8A03|nr:hypothetical protein [Bordetella sp. 15P40C-2]MVW72132.1 hypothetical protein [Bordetella sp. 15P40C-2]